MDLEAQDQRQKKIKDLQKKLLDKHGSATETSDKELAEQIRSRRKDYKR